MSDRQFVVGRPHFGRVTRTPEENAAALSEARDALATAVAADPTQPGAADLLDATVDLAEALTIAGREREAVALARPAVQLARDADRTESLGWALLALATAEHYAGLAADAEPDFDEALSVARLGADRVLEHYALHHLGRFLVDEGRTDDAVEAFTACLAIREQLGEPRAASTRAALEAVLRSRR
ncbi:tetratricopeptide repeat protein [Terrabacter terrigena]|uniref:Tetratricopeptide repeat protein n=1 Tax=Terrabacter terrigena TaxID=574718 RepID=A0ABW3MY62_9MICO